MVSSIPKASEDIEDRESLALLAASSVDLTACDGESYIERYTKSVSAVESILTLDRLRQEVAVREQIARNAKFAMQSTSISPSSGHSNFLSPNSEAQLRKTVSVPNMANMALQVKALDISTDQANEKTSNAGATFQDKSDLSYFAYAADRFRQKATSLFGSMTGLNQLAASVDATAIDDQPKIVSKAPVPNDFSTKSSAGMILFN